jgi:hypothetical protein
VVLTDDLAGAATLESGDTANAGVLDVGETWTYSATYAATQADINAGADLVNTASVVSTEVPGPTTDDATTTITQSASLTVDDDHAECVADGGEIVCDDESGCTGHGDLQLPGDQYRQRDDHGSVTVGRQ